MGAALTQGQAVVAQGLVHTSSLFMQQWKGLGNIHGKLQGETAEGGDYDVPSL